MSTATMILLIVAIAALGFAAWMWLERNRSRTLRTRFGPEYDRVVTDFRGNRRRAEEILEKRQKRVAKFPLRHLSREECDRFTSSWRREQEHFVDDPRAAVAQADRLVEEAMRARGFPVGQFDQQVEDISVEHPYVVEHYRAAHAIALRESRGEASTEDLRLAMQHYRDLFENLLETRPEEVHR